MFDIKIFPFLSVGNWTLPLYHTGKIFIFYIKAISTYGHTRRAGGFMLLFEQHNNNPHVKRAVFTLPYKGFYLSTTLKGHQKAADNRKFHYGLSLEGIFIFFGRQIILHHIFFLLITDIFSYHFII